MTSMTVLALDIGSSSVKSAVLRGDRIVGRIARAGFLTHYGSERAEVEPDDVLCAIGAAIRAIGAPAREVDCIALAVMSPAWVAMDKRGKALTPLITHQDRRSVQIARELEARIGKSRHLKLAGNRPFPGGISSTTWAWFNRHEPRLMRKADLVGHLNTFLHAQLTGARVVDPSNASFMGVYSTLTLGGWNSTLMEAVGAREHQMPQLIESDGVGGLITRAAARRFGLTHGTPMVVGMIDTGSAMLLAGATPGQLLNVAGSTDVLALCTDRPRPHERLLTRALGVGRRWLSVSTLASAGSSFTWMHHQLFRDLDDAAFSRLIRTVAARSGDSSVRFAPYLAGERTSLEQRRAAFEELTLSTTREQMLRAMVQALASASAARIGLLRGLGTPLRSKVMVSGGVGEGIGRTLHRGWPGRWTFTTRDEATLRGLGKLVPR
jgi:xylulokinase